ncbi:MAG TPA: GlsB/YeaQ/YmgE family stress response membrane protein [Dehalococcoidia bacterium]|nr:GlsB/YeaQ/YmgE family stress response membrane protein [Dehalococcoidia bacterium]
MSFEVPGIIGWIIVGLIAGWLASTLMRHKGGIVSNALLGLVGSIVGGVLFTLVGLSGASNIVGSIVIATVGAVIVLAIVK